MACVFKVNNRWQSRSDAASVIEALAVPGPAPLPSMDDMIHAESYCPVTSR